MEETRVCANCHKEFPLNEQNFRHNGGSAGFRKICKRCDNKLRKSKNKQTATAGLKPANAKKYLWAILLKLGLTQKQMADEMGEEQSNVSGWMSAGRIPSESKWPNVEAYIKKNIGDSLDIAAFLSPSPEIATPPAPEAEAEEKKPGNKYGLEYNDQDEAIRIIASSIALTQHNANDLSDAIMSYPDNDFTVVSAFAEAEYYAWKARDMFTRYFGEDKDDKSLQAIGSFRDTWGEAFREIRNDAFKWVLLGILIETFRYTRDEGAGQFFSDFDKILATWRKSLALPSEADAKGVVAA